MKKPIRNALTAIRNNINPFADLNADEDNAEDEDGAGLNDPTAANIDGLAGNMFPIVSDVPSTPQQHQSFDSFSPAPPQPAASSSTPIGENMKEMIRKKREAAIAKRKRKLEESMNTSAASSQVCCTLMFYLEPGFVAVRVDVCLNLFCSDFFMWIDFRYGVGGGLIFAQIEHIPFRFTSSECPS